MGYGQLRMKSILAAFTYVLSAAVCAATVPVPGPDGLTPCDSPADSYHAEVDNAIAAPLRGQKVASFTALPSFQPEWGVVLFKDERGFTLRVVEFDNSLWHSAYQEVRPGSFERNPAKANRSRSIVEVQVSTELAALVRQILSNEIAAASKKNERVGLDGETYRFGVGGACAQAWSPDSGSRPAQLIEAVESLRTLSHIPGSWVRRMWEGSVANKWQALAKPGKTIQAAPKGARS